jgi:phosphoglycolate phosphatase-like HAD superfamily hydrolase
MDAIERAGRLCDDVVIAELRDRYVTHLIQEIEKPGRGMKGVMPGIRQLLDMLAARDDVFLGLLTGNFEAGARIKLEHFDLWRYFRCGAYGDDAADRNLLVPFALHRARRLGLPDIPADHVLVVGDTPHDIACARAARARSVGVATGGCTADQLRASGADVVFDNLLDLHAFIALLD